MAFKITKDITYRKNGLWAKVSRMHKITGVQNGPYGPTNIWTPYWHLAVGREGELTAFLGADFPKAGLAKGAAKDYVNEVD
jgi:hypothetical protein